MGGIINKKTLSKQELFYGKVNMPKGFEIDQKKLVQDILKSNYSKTEYPFSKTLDMLNKYIIEHTKTEDSYFLCNKDTFGNVYKPNEQTKSLLKVNPMILANSPDFILLYGVKTEDCFITIFYDDNRRKGKEHIIQLKTNEFVMFPSTNLYCIKNKQKENLNFILTITYEYI